MDIFKKTYFEKKVKLENGYDGDICLKVDYANIKNDGYMVQGFTFVKEYIIISAYHKVSFCKGKSRIYFYSVKTGKYLGFVELDNSAHVGGVTYDKEKDVLFVTGSYGKVNAYCMNSLIKALKKEGKLIKYDSSNIDISLVLVGNVSAATIYFFEGNLYVATCSNVGKVVKYTIRYDEKKILVDKYQIISDAPACIQGICLFNYKDKRYYLFSQSYGKSKSTIKVLDEEFKFIGQVTLTVPGIEGIDITCDANIYGVFENSRTKVLCIPLVKLTHKINTQLEKKYISSGKIHQNILDARDKII